MIIVQPVSTQHGGAYMIYELREDQPGDRIELYTDVRAYIRQHHPQPLLRDMIGRHVMLGYDLPISVHTDTRLGHHLPSIGDWRAERR